MGAGKTFEGEFRPPGMARSVTPILIGGPGRCVVSPEGLVVEGQKVRSQGPVMLLILFGMLLAFFGLVTSLGLDLDSRGTKVLGVIVMLGALAISTALAKRQKAKEPTKVVFPWASIKDAREEGDLALVVVKKFKPKGGLYFAPREGLDGFLQAVNDARRA
ncbi:MAG: hypothetical protein AAF928_12815 [Myxococcota bacterium]